MVSPEPGTQAWRDLVREDIIDPGRRIIDRMLHASLSQMTRQRPQEQRDDTRKSLEQALSDAANPKGVLEQFESLESKWTPPAQTGFESADGEDAA